MYCGNNGLGWAKWFYNYNYAVTACQVSVGSL